MNHKGPFVVMNRESEFMSTSNDKPYYNRAKMNSPRLPVCNDWTMLQGERFCNKSVDSLLCFCENLVKANKCPNGFKRRE